MFKAFRNRVTEYNQLAKTINNMHILLLETYFNVKTANNPDDYKSKIWTLAYLVSRDINPITGENKWNMDGKIFIPSMDKRNISLSKALSTINLKLSQISNMCNSGVKKGVTEILAKGDLYYFMDNIRKPTPK